MKSKNRHGFITMYRKILLTRVVQAIISLAIVLTIFLLANPLVEAHASGNMREMMQSMMGDVLPPGIDPKLLPDPTSQGAHLVTHYCSQCHNLPGPGMHTAAEWPAVVQRMNRRMQMMSGGKKCGGMMGGSMMNIQAPSARELKALLSYLQTHAQKPMNIDEYSDMSTPAGKTFHAVCSQCHALPDPGQHTAKEWPNVVMRMKKNMSIMHKKIPDDAASQAIIRFLQKHAMNKIP